MTIFKKTDNKTKKKKAYYRNRIFKTIKENPKIQIIDTVKSIKEQIGHSERED